MAPLLSLLPRSGVIRSMNISLITGEESRAEPECHTAPVCSHHAKPPAHPHPNPHPNPTSTGPQRPPQPPLCFLLSPSRSAASALTFVLLVSAPFFPQTPLFSLVHVMVPFVPLSPYSCDNPTNPPRPPRRTPSLAGSGWMDGLFVYRRECSSCPTDQPTGRNLSPETMLTAISACQLCVSACVGVCVYTWVVAITGRGVVVTSS